MLFNSVSSKIRSFEGCEYLELLEHPRYPNMVATYSLWKSEYYLEKYRESELFSSTWAKTKKLFVAPPQATSYLKVRKLP